MTEFTGERVIPGQVNPDLWNEHYSRYVFASRSTSSTARVLDLGCGAGYGSASLARGSASVLGIDVSAEAIGFARANFPADNLTFLQASCTDLPLAPETFDLVTAFEVIEHLANWPALIAEARRVLKPSGVFLVSTPNTIYYAESRSQDGPNPYHAHEFEFAEFGEALRHAFPYVEILLQNRSECLAFAPCGSAAEVNAYVEEGKEPPSSANFFIGVCTQSPLPAAATFLYVPKTANVLRERERHIAKLEGELEINRRWLTEIRAERQTLIQHLDDQKAHVEKQNLWSQQLDRELRSAQIRIGVVQDEFHAEQRAAQELAREYDGKIAELEQENRAKTEWAQETERRLTIEIELERARVVEVLGLLDRAETTVVERTQWALSLQEQLEGLNAKLEMARASRFMRAGRKLGVGPQL